MKSAATTEMQTTTTISNPLRGAAAERKVAMTSTIETEVREFAREFPTPNVKLMVQLCEQGRISWAQAHELSRQALAKGLTAVAQ